MCKTGQPLGKKANKSACFCLVRKTSSDGIGIVFTSLLFGALYQGGAELAFEMPRVTRELVVVIQGLVILFSGALEHMLRPRIEALFRRRAISAEG